MYCNTTTNGKRLHNYGKSPFLMGKNSLFLWPFSVAMLNYQRVCTIHSVPSEHGDSLNVKFMSISSKGKVGLVYMYA